MARGSGILFTCFKVAVAASSVFYTVGAQQISSSTLEKFADVLSLPTSFDPIIAAYWTGLPHHRRTPFAISPDGTSAYLAFLDSTLGNVYVQQVDPSTFAAVGDAVEVSGAKEAGGLVAQNDGFALLATVAAEGTTDLPPDDYPIAAIFRYKDGALAWKTPINGPGVHESDGYSASPDMNGDLVYSETAGLYAAYFVVTAYSGWASGHFGDSIMYVNDSGEIQTITGASSTWGCSHNTGIALEAADAAPFASVCAEDHGAIWLNTATQGMSGVKIANENVTTGVSGEPMGGMSGSYSSLALFSNTTQYIFAWQSRGAVNLKEDTWMGDGFTSCDPRWLNHNVAIAVTKDKQTLVGDQAISVVGASSGDDQVNWITESDSVDHQNVRVATFNSDNALVTWEQIENPDCQPVPMSCSGTFAGTYMQQVDRDGNKVGDAITVDDVYVSGDIVNIGDGRLCWPYVNMSWDLSTAKSSGTPVTKMSFACLSLSGSSTSANSSSASSSAKASTSTAVVTEEEEASDTSSTSRTFVSATSSAATIDTPSSAETSTTLVVNTTGSATLPAEANPTEDVATSTVDFQFTSDLDAATTDVTETTTAESAIIATSSTKSPVVVTVTTSLTSYVTVYPSAAATKTVDAAETETATASDVPSQSGAVCSSNEDCGDGKKCVKGKISWGSGVCAESEEKSGKSSGWGWSWGWN